MQTRIALIGIVMEDFDETARLNELLHEYRQFVIGRMGIPYAKRTVGIISVALDAPQDVISSLAGKIGMLKGVQVKTIYSNVYGDS